ncbi:ATP-binding protein [Actinomadura madurae]|uniref:CO dehydrogenase maturation factor n=1 Tax=Actinomadura madurae TaxID=1993 RepID=A0A1I5KYZ6_9ACTN|nr:ATP-binding protein [Actinomadura madurae]MCP9949654.1 ATP-binding protein [Actinomadura madurae]MCP9966407.1 ATP-binding protein [Actinomadura madurae]MCP9978896.1 ATP-binding protein [Actinomadura madurae]MCQ0015082.1 ATP-binding protein [Actinomadura madurae]SFO90118.1 CO dehydrogenase maturation factor [Actinomadura madurae]
MKVAFVGKGGSGKTTLSSLFVRHLAGRGLPVVAIDADINQHLGVALGLDEARAAKIPALGDRLTEIKDHLRGTNPRISGASAMVKTTPPGTGSRLLRFRGEDPVHEAGQEVDGVTLLATGPFNDDDLGVACYHSKTGAVELYLNHLVDGPGEYVVVDMTAGADTFASGLFTRFDLMFLVAEPTRKGVGVYRQYTEYARDYDVSIRVVGNKVQSEDDVAYLREHVGDDLLTWLGQSAAVRALEQGRHGVELEDGNAAALDRMRAEVDACVKDWDRFQRQAVEFHVKNARSWASRAAGEDLEAQVDPDFRFPSAADAAYSG